MCSVYLLRRQIPDDDLQRWLWFAVRHLLRRRHGGGARAENQ